MSSALSAWRSPRRADGAPFHILAAMPDMAALSLGRPFLKLAEYLWRHRFYVGWTLCAAKVKISLSPSRAIASKGPEMASLYERLGGEKAVNAAVELFYRRVLADGRIARFFEGVDMEGQIAKQKSFLTMVFGGPNKYSGLDMRNAHKRLVEKGLNDSHVDAVIENLNSTLRQLGVGEKEVKEVAALANSVRDDVLNR